MLCLKTELILFAVIFSEVLHLQDISRINFKISDQTCLRQLVAVSQQVLKTMYLLRSVHTANNMTFTDFVNSFMNKSLNVTLPGFLIPWDSRYSAKCPARHAPPFSASLYLFLHNRLGWLIVYQLIVSLYTLNDYIYMHSNTKKAAV